MLQPSPAQHAKPNAKAKAQDQANPNSQHPSQDRPGSFGFGNGIGSRPTLDDHGVCPRSRPWFVMLAWWVSADLIKKRQAGRGTSMYLSTFSRSTIWATLRPSCATHFLFLRRVGPDREGGIIAALPSFNNLIAVGSADPVGNPLLQPRTKINNLTAVLAGSLI